MRSPHVAALVAVVLLTVGCSSTPEGPAVVSPDAWAGSVCAALDPWRTQLEQLNGQVTRDMANATTPADTKKNLVAMLTGAERASATARDRIARAGLPDVTSGRRIADRFVASLAAMRDAYRKAGRTIQALDTTDAKVFYGQVEVAMNTLMAEYQQAGLESAKGSSPQLRRAFDEAAECR